ncbi:hypothetical protein BGX27_007288 [Mortierella sp. AM989]|nr:hypothetical protein BGX27_007288 [Mortierella sp. AM989]
MHTAELITLLRSHERTHPKAKNHLATLDQARRLHLLGELSNWLLAELQKYHHRQAGPTALESPQQGSIRSQIRHTLFAIQVLLDSFSSIPIPPSDHQAKSTSKTPVLLDDKGKEKVLESFLRSILIGIVPLGPRIDSTDVQQLCAKILCYCTNPLTKNAPFQPQTLIRKMMTMTRLQEQQQQRQPIRLDRDRSKEPLSADVLVGFTALLQSPMIKLQEYGLRILTSHRLIVQLDQTWELLAPLKNILEELKNNMVQITSDQQVELFGQDLGVVNANLEHTDSVIGSDGGGKITKDLESIITVQSKALTLLQWSLQEVGKPPNIQASSSHSDLGRRMEILKEAADVRLLAELWRAVQHVVLFDRAKLATISERLVLLTSASVYWVCWIFQDEALTYIISDSADTLMAWYGYYITSHDRVSEIATSPSSPSSVSIPTSTTRATLQEKVDLRQKSSVLEYLSKLIQNMVTSKKHHPTLFVGNPPIGIVIMRRTVEFLESILESSLPITDQDSVSDSAISMPNITIPSGDIPSMDAKPPTYPIWIIQEKPGVLEAMLGIMVGCYGGSQEASSLALNSQILHILLLLLSNIQDLFAMRNLTESTARKIRQLSLNLLLLILKQDGHIQRIDDVPMDHWSLGYRALVDMVMLPLEIEANTVSTQLVAPAAQNMAVDEEVGLKALKAFTLFWKHHTKGRSMLSDLLAPRLHQLRIVPILIGGQYIDDKTSKWKRERTLLLLETIIHFGNESSVRINMRERWSSLSFLVAILGSGIKRLELNGYSSKDTLSRMIVKRCFLAMRNFWFDRLGMVQMIELDIPPSESSLWEEMMPPSVDYERRSSKLTTASVVPLLTVILSPLGTSWSSELMLHSPLDKQSTGRRLRYPLFERRDPLLAEAALMLAKLSQFRECQERLLSKPGAIWMVSRMMVERSLVGDSNTDITAAVVEADDTPPELLEKSLFEVTTKIMSAESLAKSLVSNNTITELFAAIMETDMPMYFYRSKSIFEGPIITETKLGAEPDENQIPGNDCTSQILPALRQHELHRQLLRHFRTVMTPLRAQFERIFQYIGGNRSLQDAGDTAETVYWLREYCALIFTYILEPPGPSSSIFWGTRVDRTAVLNSESIFGIVCRMLTLELEYDDIIDDTAVKESTTSIDHGQTTTNQQDDLVNVQQEEALLRRFSAGLAIQSLCWKHVNEWRRQHLNLVRSYATVETTEWEAYVAALKGIGNSDGFNNSDKLAATFEKPTSVDFMVQDRVISFPDRLVLSRTSEFFHALLMGEYKEASQKHILIQDVQPDDFELLIEVVKESRLTARLLLPEDLPLSVVLRLMVCAHRFMVTFVKRMAETWILNALGAREFKYYEMKQHPQADNSEVLVAHNNTKHLQDFDSITQSQEKRRKLDNEDGDMDVQEDKEAEEDTSMESNENEESISESLLMVFEVCSDSQHGTLYSITHPFYGLVWDVLKRMTLRLGSVATTPRFATMLNDGGEERIQEFLQIIYDLIVNNVPTVP